MTLARLSHIARIWQQLLAQYCAISMAYRAQSAIYMVGGLMPIAIMLIWIELAANGPISGNGTSYGRDDFAIYFMGLYLVRQATVTWCVMLLDRGIRHGELAPLLLRPMPPVWAHMAEHLGEIITRLPVLLGVFLLGLILTGTFGRLSVPSVSLFILALAGAWLVSFNLQYCVGLLAFWMEGTLSLEPLVYYLIMILGGGMIPLDLFPTVIRDILAWLPFASVLDFPGQILLARIDGAALLLGFAKQLCWIIALVMLRQQIWQTGLKRFSAMRA